MSGIDFTLAIVEFLDDRHRVRYLCRPFQREPDFGVTSVNYDFAQLLSTSRDPSLNSVYLDYSSFGQARRKAARPGPKSSGASSTATLRAAISSNNTATGNPARSAAPRRSTSASW